MTTALICQARMNSKRFPKKVLADLCGHPVLWHVLTRCQMVEGIDRIVLAIPDEAASDEIEVIAENLGIKVSRGPEDDVLTRYRDAARRVKADYIMRITADCPLIDPVVCSAVLAAAQQPGVDYACNVMPRTFEKGLDCEVFSRWTLELTAKNATTPHDREHVTAFMQTFSLFHRVNVESGNPRRARINLCIDYPKDIARVSRRLMERNAA